MGMPEGSFHFLVWFEPKEYLPVSQRFPLRSDSRCPFAALEDGVGICRCSRCCGLFVLFILSVRLVYY